MNNKKILKAILSVTCIFSASFSQAGLYKECENYATQKQCSELEISKITYEIAKNEFRENKLLGLIKTAKTGKQELDSLKKKRKKLQDETGQEFLQVVLNSTKPVDTYYCKSYSSLYGPSRDIWLYREEGHCSGLLQTGWKVKLPETREGLDVYRNADYQTENLRFKEGAELNEEISWLEKKYKIAARDYKKNQRALIRTKEKLQKAKSDLETRLK